MSTERIDVTKSFLPPVEEYTSYLNRIWESVWLTNQGQLVQEFEKRVAEYLGVQHFQFVSNGTIALQFALRALGVTEGEVITTPFSYVASTSAIMWERCTPVFVDIEPNTFCIDVNKIEAAITKNTKAILAVHVFGFVCNVEKIAAIAKKHNLKVIYDGAHAFGVTYKGKSLLEWGDVSTCSFHATKLFHTVEGGAVIAKDKAVNDKIEGMKHFGHAGDDHYMLGINGKVSEFHAAMGLANFKYIDQNIADRKAVAEQYDQGLQDRFYRPTTSSNVQHNYAYYPVVFETEAQLLDAFARLKSKNIFPRRYFYPSLNTLPYVKGKSCPISESVSSRVACLPLFPGIKKETVANIIQTINEV